MRSSRFRWLVGPIEYQVYERSAHSADRNDAVLRWIFIARMKQGEIRRFSLRFSAERRRFTAGDSGKHRAFDNQRREELERIYFPSGPPLVAPPEGSLLTVLRNMITDIDIATATTLSLTGKLP